MEVINFTPQEKYNCNYRKENWPFKEYALIDAEQLRQRFILRVYYDFQASTVYAACWIHSMSASGTGKAGGYGYHKGSAAAAEAMENAGLKFSEPIAGRGESLIIEAIEAFAAYQNIERFCIHISNA